jgi:hypothetical protein
MPELPDTTALLRQAITTLGNLPTREQLDAERRSEIEVQRASALALVAIGIQLESIRSTLGLISYNLEHR